MKAVKMDKKEKKLQTAHYLTLRSWFVCVCVCVFVQKNAKGYQIARLYFEVKEYDIARR